MNLTIKIDEEPEHTYMLADGKTIYWTALGTALCASASDAFEGALPPVDLAYAFLLDNPECFTDSDEWPEGMPEQAPAELIAGYYGVSNA